MTDQLRGHAGRVAEVVGGAGERLGPAHLFAQLADEGVAPLGLQHASEELLRRGRLGQGETEQQRRGGEQDTHQAAHWLSSSEGSPSDSTASEY